MILTFIFRLALLNVFYGRLIKLYPTITLFFFFFLQNAVKSGRDGAMLFLFRPEICVQKVWHSFINCLFKSDIRAGMIVGCHNPLEISFLFVLRHFSLPLLFTRINRRVNEQGTSARQRKAIDG